MLYVDQGFIIFVLTINTVLQHFIYIFAFRLRLVQKGKINAILMNYL